MLKHDMELTQMKNKATSSIGLLWIITFLLAVTSPALCTNHNLTVTAGETAFLICSQSNDLNETFWSGPPDFMTYSFPGSTEIPPTLSNADRLEINATNAALLVHNATLDDQGVYRCSAGIKLADTLLIVTNIPPTSIVVDNIEYIGSRRIVRGSENLNVTLNCSVNGAKPEANITWTRTDINATLQSDERTMQYLNGTFFTSEELILNATRSLDRVTLRCSVKHPRLKQPVILDQELYLSLKPRLTELPSEIIVTEGIPAILECEIRDCRPKANLTLLFGDKIFNGTEHGSFNFNNLTETYTITTAITATLDRSEAGKNLTCVVDHQSLLASVHTSGSIAVHYPPVVTITGNNASVDTGSTVLQCSAINGNPAKYTFGTWKQILPEISGVIRDLHPTMISAKTASLTLEPISYQDSGVYKCRASNGVHRTGNQSEWIEKGILLTVSDVPLVLNGQSYYPVRPNEEFEVILDVYSNVDVIDVSLLRNPSTEGTTAEWSFSQTHAIIVLPIYNKTISKSGYRISLSIHLRSADNYGNYSIVIRNFVGPTIHSVQFVPTDETSSVLPAGNTSNKKSNIGVIIGAVVASVVVIVAIVVIGCICHRRVDCAGDKNGKKNGDEKVDCAGDKNEVETKC